MLPANLEREIESAAQIRNLQKRVRRLETLPLITGAGCLTLLEDITLAVSASSITFSSISQAHRHLWLWINAGVVVDSTPFHMQMTFNGDTAANYRYSRIRHVGTAHSAGGGTGVANYIELEIPSSSDVESVSGHEINIYDYTSIVKEKVATWKAWELSGASQEVPASVGVGIGGGHWRTETSAISSITITKGGGGDFAINSQFSLYGLC